MSVMTTATETRQMTSMEFRFRSSLQNGYKNSALETAVSANNPEWVKEALDAGASVNESDTSDKIYPLIQAIICGCRLEIIKKLITAGADVNSRDREGKTPLIHAVDTYCIDQSDATKARRDLIRSLHNAGADLAEKVWHGGTPFCVPCEKPHPL